MFLLLRLARLACLCACLCFASPLLATAQEESELPATEALMERLEQAEAEIRSLKAGVFGPEEPAPLSENSADDVSTYDVSNSAAGPRPPPAETSSVAALTKQFEDFKAAAAQIKYPTVQVNGVFQAESGWFHQDENSMATLGDIQDGADFRRARLSAKGAVAPNVNYMMQFDFGFVGRPTFTDLWFDVVQVPWLGNVRVGQWKQPFGLEVVTSFRYQTFIERSLLFQAFEPFRHIGVGTYNWSEDEMMTWAASVYRTGNDQFGNDIGDNGGVSFAGRVTWLPWYEETGDQRYYLHTGAAYLRGDPANDAFRYATIPEYFVGAFGLAPASPVGTSRSGVPNVSNGTPPFVDTGTFGVENFQHFGGELAWIHGPFSIQSEAQIAIVDQTAGSQIALPGMYIFGSYFLTGESRPYDRKAGAFDRVKPRRDFITTCGSVCGPGAWELATRYSYIDLNDKNIAGGRLSDWTLGMNWYLNPYTKFQANYIRAFLDNPVFDKSETDIFALRAQVDF